MIAREVLRNLSKLLAVVRHLHGLHFVQIDARPDDMAMIAAMLDMEDDGARLAGQTELFLGTIDKFVVKIAGKRSLTMVGIDGEGVQVFVALRCCCLRLPFSEGAMQILRDGAAHVGCLDTVVVVFI